MYFDACIVSVFSVYLSVLYTSCCRLAFSSVEGNCFRDDMALFWWGGSELNDNDGGQKVLAQMARIEDVCALFFVTRMLTCLYVHMLCVGVALVYHLQADTTQTIFFFPKIRIKR